MHLPTPVIYEGLPTGKVRPRIGTFGAVLMQVEVELKRSAFPSDPGEIVGTKWRDATKDDVYTMPSYFKHPED